MIYKFLISSAAQRSAIVEKVVRYVLRLCLEYLVRKRVVRPVWSCETDFAHEPNFKVFESEEMLERHYECVGKDGECLKMFGYVIKSFVKE